VTLSSLAKMKFELILKLEVWELKVMPRQGVVTYASPAEVFVTRNQAINGANKGSRQILND